MVKPKKKLEKKKKSTAKADALRALRERMLVDQPNRMISTALNREN